MPVSEDGQITSLLRAFGEGDRDAFDELVPLIYEDLRRLARRQMRRGVPGATLDTTGLVHEAWLKLAASNRLSVRDRQHFLAVSVRAMRQVVIAFARRRNAVKRGAGERAVTLDEARIAIDDQSDSLLALDEALGRLGRYDRSLAQVVECRYFAGLSEEETSVAMGVSLRTAQRSWMRARAWLREELGGASGAA